ncbi:hypothetical protein HBI56_214790 [Parastagonospora nodorum]|uniref:Uncharacterized protein n=1 Tax=Phaeosphaeria nodorum (strain SN15 / ATCC MYA-4574 / FGSC 10173) TaxID=321614 RepID=A0A7U2F638_PHANO|nr:hypothetical protein HBH56_230750 [Parastagonospora nodorum]QRC99437.1 hypothetical protein JI435_413470 [Parastagonospora nodorum SN15]KAH3924566.1 hypothetical protein HBH54_194410 [Parastagonospora nodorum]KAH3940118.1 hypothetical protein HBH53_222000 [Parastagonospora nodorum]KAH3958328.1 hypothetical protein HBH51_210470 [Parastagonospora nodorum]
MPTAHIRRHKQIAPLSTIAKHPRFPTQKTCYSFNSPMRSIKPRSKKLGATCRIGRSSTSIFVRALARTRALGVFLCEITRGSGTEVDGTCEKLQADEAPGLGRGCMRKSARGPW